MANVALPAALHQRKIERRGRMANPSGDLLRGWADSPAAVAAAVLGVKVFYLYCEVHAVLNDDHTNLALG